MGNYFTTFGRGKTNSPFIRGETYIKIKGKWHYLYRAIDADGLTLDIWLRKKRDTQAAYAFLKRLVK
jgi:putative transposase